MAVEKKGLKDYWEYFLAQRAFVLVLFQIIFCGLLIMIMGLALDLSPASKEFWIGFLSLSFVFFIIQVATQMIILKPTHDLINLILKLKTQDQVVDVPKSKLFDYDESGLTKLMQYVYDLKISNSLLTQQQDNKADKDTTKLPLFLLQSLDASNVGIAILDHHQKIIYANEAAPVKHGIDDELEFCLQFRGKDTIANWIKSLSEKAIRAEKVWQRITNTRNGSDEEPKYYDLIASYTNGNLGETIVVVIDRTETYKVDEEELDFVAFAAHELRGPITIIRGYLDIMSEELSPQLTAEYQNLFNRMIVSANRLSGYINNILNVSKYDQQHLQLVLGEIKVGDIFDAIIDDITLRASSQQRLLSVNIPSNLPTVAADISSISEVFTNLVDNAIKYSNEGGSVEINARRNGDTVEIDVTDHGIGMPPNVMANLFSKFYRSHRTSGNVGGTGIGLYISRAIVESHDGNISVRSAEGEGSTFTVSLPTFDSIKDKLRLNQNSNSEFIRHSSSGWIRNHGKIRR